MGTEIFDIPLQSSDLNPNEHIQEEIKCRYHNNNAQNDG